MFKNKVTKTNPLSGQQDKQTKAHGHKIWTRHEWLTQMEFPQSRQKTHQFANKSINNPPEESIWLTSFSLHQFHKHFLTENWKSDTNFNKGYDTICGATWLVLTNPGKIFPSLCNSNKMSSSFSLTKIILVREQPSPYMSSGQVNEN